MKRLISLLLALCLAGCASSDHDPQNTAESESASGKPAYETNEFTNEYNNVSGNLKDADSWTAEVQCTYDMSHQNTSISHYYMDGIIAAQDLKQDPKAHLRQNYSSEGMDSSLSGWFYGDRLYITYNQVDYYDDMKFTDVEDLMLVPLEPADIPEKDIDSISREMDGGRTSYRILLTDKGAEKWFTEHYDFYGVKDADGFDMKEGTITQVFDETGNIVSETAEFSSSVKIQEMDVDVLYNSSCVYSSVGSTNIGLTEQVKAVTGEYVHYSEINVDEISDYDAEADSAESDVIETLKKRLVYRLGYTEQEDGTYLAEYNDGESYRFDFNNSLFIYLNHTSSYVYSWRGDTGGFGTTCNYDFASDTGGSTCTEETIEMIRKVRDFLKMELYYCGLTMDDLTTYTGGN